MQIIDASYHPNDVHGYSVYGLVLAAPEPIASRVQRLRDQLRPAWPMFQAHVTALGAFCEIESVDRVCEQVAGVVAGTGALTMTPTGEIWGSPDGLLLSTARIEVTPELQSLHDRLARAVLPMATNAYHDPADYHPHLTYFQRIPESAKKLGTRLVAEFDLEEFTVDPLSLTGRVGTGPDGERRVIREFPFTG